MQPNSYLVGNSAVITLSVVSDGALTDPSTLSLEIVMPDSPTPTTSIYGAGAITRQSTGIYKYTLTLSAPGLYKYRWHTSTPSSGAVEGYINCLPSVL
jgi:hypothetical protein